MEGCPNRTIAPSTIEEGNPNVVVIPPPLSVQENKRKAMESGKGLNGTTKLGGKMQDHVLHSSNEQGIFVQGGDDGVSIEPQSANGAPAPTSNPSFYKDPLLELERGEDEGLSWILGQNMNLLNIMKSLYGSKYRGVVCLLLGIEIPISFMLILLSVGRSATSKWFKMMKDSGCVRDQLELMNINFDRRLYYEEGIDCRFYITGCFPHLDVPIYDMLADQINPLHVSIYDGLDKIYGSFIRGGAVRRRKTHWINWDKVCLPK
ncbi:unnamed protein product [Lupinus luteus]|uniref:Uncharacterized protein n=1 Tax=Lupinus luteus TaxID=3873 RepID=A0AAV1XN99_LUPLU